MRIGFIGLGTMGSEMARQLVAADYDVTVYDLRPEAVASAESWGATAGENLGDTVGGKDVVFLSLPGPDEVRAVVEGHDGIASSADSGTVVVDATTSLPAVTDELDAKLAEEGIELLGAPVSGGRSGAKAGTLSVMAGGPQNDFEDCEPLLDCIAEDVFYLGGTPSEGHAMKLLNNYLSFTGFVATCEAAILGRQAGLDLDSMLDVFNASSGRNSATEDKFPEYVVTESFDLGATLAIMEKDIDLATQFGDDVGVPMAVAEQVCQLIGYASSYLGEDADYTQVYQFFEAMMLGEERTST